MSLIVWQLGFDESNIYAFRTSRLKLKPRTEQLIKIKTTKEIESLTGEGKIGPLVIGEERDSTEPTHTPNSQTSTGHGEGHILLRTPPNGETSPAQSLGRKRRSTANRYQWLTFPMRLNNQETGLFLTPHVGFPLQQHEVLSIDEILLRFTTEASKRFQVRFSWFLKHRSS
ncbi:unnamed protein product, partial [Iphiclides podalirius]